ncbi:DUF4149 domain-containing protein [Massilia sp. ST3]|uniref:DUF4149 domain-containing protein n=1 Tax=Massilia sp. ST3 TaxID=2824903 RepID=UPI001B811232|nr:DUF4149 domain-containing protein [Massilia sp. ST3]MBQ5949224.1 DUF4149 domain-containing protein [Massilia sp. ST3]
MADGHASAPARGRLAGARLLLACLWAGSLWALGYVAAPAAFAVLPSNLAGDVVSVILARQAWLSIGCAMLLLVLLLRFSSDVPPAKRRFLGGLVLAMLACTLVIFVGLQPAMAHLRELAGVGGVRASPYWTQFAVMHGVSQLFHLVESLLGAWLVLKSR